MRPTGVPLAFFRSSTNSFALRETSSSSWIASGVAGEAGKVMTCFPALPSASASESATVPSTNTPKMPDSRTFPSSPAVQTSGPLTALTSPVSTTGPGIAAASQSRVTVSSAPGFSFISGESTSTSI